MLKNKGPVLITFLSQIILVIVLLQVTGFLRGLAIAALLGTEVLLLATLYKEKTWNYQSWYTFLLFIVILFLILTNFKANNADDAVFVEMILAEIIGFFLLMFPEKEPKKKAPKVDVVNIQPPKKPTAKKTTKEIIVSVEGSKKYHVPTCRYAKKAPKSKITIYTSKQQAGRKKLKKCKVCIK